MTCAVLLFLAAAILGVIGFLLRQAGSSEKVALCFVSAILAVLVALVLIAGEMEKRKSQAEAARAQAEREEQQRQAEEARRADIRNRAGELFAEARKLSKEKNYEAAVKQLEALAAVVPDHPGLQEQLATDRKLLEQAKEKQRQQEERDRLRLERETKLLIRRGMEDSLRTGFLDAGLDIKVRVSGSNADRIKLTYVLFNDVWSHRFQKEGRIDELCRQGFKRIEMSDGYDWGVYWTCR